MQHNDMVMHKYRNATNMKCKWMQRGPWMQQMTNATYVECNENAVEWCRRRMQRTLNVWKWCHMHSTKCNDNAIVKMHYNAGTNIECNTCRIRRIMHNASIVRTRSKCKIARMLKNVIENSRMIYNALIMFGAQITRLWGTNHTPPSWTSRMLVQLLSDSWIDCCSFVSIVDYLKTDLTEVRVST